MPQLDLKHTKAGDECPITGCGGIIGEVQEITSPKGPAMKEMRCGTCGLTGFQDIPAVAEQLPLV